MTVAEYKSDFKTHKRHLIPCGQAMEWSTWKLLSTRMNNDFSYFSIKIHIYNKIFTRRNDIFTHLGCWFFSTSAIKCLLWEFGRKLTVIMTSTVFALLEIVFISVESSVVQDNLYCPRPSETGYTQITWQWWALMKFPEGKWSNTEAGLLTESLTDDILLV